MESKFKKLLEEKDMSGARLGRKIGVTRSLISRWVSGKSLPRTKDIPKIAEILGVTVERVLECFTTHK